MNNNQGISSNISSDDSKKMEMLKVEGMLKSKDPVVPMIVLNKQLESK